MTQLTPSQLINEAHTLADIINGCNKEFLKEYITWINEQFNKQDADAIKSSAMDIAWAVNK